MSQEITFPWFPKELSPNSRCHWAKKARAVKVYRRTCWALALEAKLDLDWCAEIYLHVTFHPPSKRNYDMDNAIASAKPLFDGLADALDVNDRLFRIVPFMGAPDGGSVHIRISPMS